MYDIQLTKKAEKTYKKADSLLRNKFNRCFDNLKNDPYHHPNIKQLKGNLQQIAIKLICVQNLKTLPRVDLVTKPCGGFDQKLL